eukprot:scaffold48170_cov36-Tisochrysis_lutea.AAC.3
MVCCTPFGRRTTKAELGLVCVLTVVGSGQNPHEVSLQYSLPRVHCSTLVRFSLAPQYGKKAGGIMA